MDEELTGNDAGGKNFTVTVRSEGQCKRLLDIEIPEEELERERSVITERLRQDLKVPGFRKGKVPLTYVRKNYAEVIHGDAVRNLLPRVYEEALQQESLHPLGEPRFDDVTTEPGEGIKATATVEVRPDIEVTGYDEIPVEATRKEIGEAEVMSTLQDIRERLASFETVERPAQSSDYLTINYAPYTESGEIDEAARQENYPVELSSENLFEEFRAALSGMSAGEETDIEVKYPDDFADKALAGGTKRFHVKVVEVQERLLPELDDGFAKKLNSEVESLDELKERVRKDLEHEEQHRYEHEVEEKAVDYLIEKNPFEVPQVMVENYLASVLEEDRRRRPQVPDESAREREVREMFTDAAKRAIRKYFILDAVAEQEAIRVSEDEVRSRVDKMAADSGRPVEEVQGYLRHPERRRRLESDILDRKVLDLIRGRTRVKEPS